MAGNVYVGIDGTTNVFYGDGVTLVGVAGNDTLTGGSNGATNGLYGDTSFIYNYPPGGDDVLRGGNNASNFMVGDAFDLSGRTVGGNDTITGGNNNASNVAFGDASRMSLGSVGGNDVLIGGSFGSNNELFGDAGLMESGAKGGNDTITGGSHAANLLVGDANFLDASSSGGNDRLISSAATTDNMWGDSPHMQGKGGRDTFVFSPGNGNDFIYDFRQGEDHIELDGFVKYFANIPPWVLHLEPSWWPFWVKFSDLAIQTADVNNDGVSDSVIHLDASNSITVYGVAHLTSADFLFVH